MLPALNKNKSINKTKIQNREEILFFYLMYPIPDLSPNKYFSQLCPVSTKKD